MTADGWSRALDRLEADLLQAEALADDPQLVLELEPWTPPTELGALPHALAERARRLLDRQRTARQLIADRLAAVRRQRALMTRVPAATGTGRESRPVYVDRSV